MGPLPQKTGVSIFCLNHCAMFWNELKINFPISVIFKYNCFLSIWLQKKSKKCTMFWNGLLSSWVFFCAIFSFWDMVDFVNYLRNASRTWLKTNSQIFKIYFFLPPTPPIKTVPLDPHAFESRTLASLYSVWIRFAKISCFFFASP